MFHYGSAICKAIPLQPAIIVAATYSANGRLHQDTISGPRSTLDTHVLPDDGVYVVYKNRALKIAAAPCERRICNHSQICSCNADYYSSAPIKQVQSQARHTNKPCNDCLVNWLHLYEAAEHVRALGLCFLASPQTLTWTNSFGYHEFRYDLDLEEQRGPFSCKNSSALGTSKDCSHALLDWMQDAWKTFIVSGNHKHANVVALSDDEDESEEDSASASDSDWDDVDVPVQANESQLWEEDIDFIDDLIEEEFPKLKKTHFNSACTVSRDEGHTSTQSDDETEDDDPVPVIIPPKNMVIGRGLMLST
ncbi:Uu.00g000940.m01.CDS01 [Anthostomella pinea]|uniref:Uu.00g000940.m01.CDS01 n=1 Tax=Anthostomella pinea TaxID=933095 RepID=A0AAI8VKE7_9PEZI|nr:Uu.00g000940.m01.CDS01 [Anthostomella pinea]